MLRVCIASIHQNGVATRWWKKFEHMFIRFDMIHEREKIAVFTYRSQHFCFPWRRSCDYHAICCMDGKTIQCLPNPSQYVPYLFIFNRFRVKRCLSQCVSPKIAIFTTFFVSPGDARPWGNNAKCCMNGKRIRCLQIVSQHVPIYL